MDTTPPKVKLWFIADTHFGHANILNFKRKDGSLLRSEFSSAAEMDEFMVAQWNARVRPGDHVYHLGDVAMDIKLLLVIIPRLNGRKRLIRGNHDRAKTKYYLKAGFEEIYGTRVFDNMIFSHIPIHPQSVGRFRANVHGHTHANDVEPVLRLDKETQAVSWVPYINVCVEKTGYRPMLLEEVQKMVREATNGKTTTQP